MNNINNNNQNNSNNNNNRYANRNYGRRGYFPTVFDFFSRPLDDFSFFPESKNGVERDNFRVDLKDCGDHYQLKAEMPGVKKEDIKVDFNDGVLTIKAEHNTEKKSTDEAGFLIKERSYGTYERQFKFDDADPDNINAAFVGGELDISVKKLEEKSSARKISIN